LEAHKGPFYFIYLSLFIIFSRIFGRFYSRAESTSPSVIWTLVFKAYIWRVSSIAIDAILDGKLQSVPDFFSAVNYGTCLMLLRKSRRTVG